LAQRCGPCGGDEVTPRVLAATVSVPALLRRASAAAAQGVARFRASVAGQLHSVAADAVAQKQFLRAEVSYRLILRLTGRDPAAIAGLIDLYRQVGCPDRAIDLERKLIVGAPDDFFRYLDLVGLYLHSGQPSEAEACWQSAARINPGSHLLRFMRGHLYRSADLLEEASQCFREALAVDPGLAVAALSLSLTLSDLNERHQAEATLEDILRVDPSCVAAYGQLASLRYFSDPGHPHVAPLQRLLREKGSLRSEYLDGCLKMAAPEKLFFDKTLVNYLELGLVSIVFPAAKVIHCTRDPLDTCLSCYFKYFESVPYANSLSMLGLMYREYQRLMAHWCAVCPSRICEIAYEDMVSDFGGTVRKLLDYCGLVWNPDCLAFYRTRRSVRTASHYQVKMPRYRSSVGRWRHYDKFLGDLRASLDR
jgi:tetratricopeptide (TPR) repeat protein